MLDPETREIKQWDVSGVPPESSLGLYVCLRDHLQERKEWLSHAKTILIEKQPPRNKKMIGVQDFLHAFFVITNPNAETIIYDAKHKIPDVTGPGKAQYRKRKLTAIARCKDFIEAGEVNAHWREVFDKSRKKDDLADTVMQALSYVNRRVVEAPTRKKSIPGSRRPTENQKESKYSKSNLVWLYKQGVHEKDKRFLKDLKRYWTGIDEFKRDCDLN
jgi:hypothetical protein